MGAVAPEADAVDALIVPGIGQVSAGWDESDARARGLVAAHVHRVAAALIDRGSDRGHEQAQEGSLPSAFDAVLRPGLPAVGRVFIVTGAASGIGRDVARHLSGLGAHLGLADVDASGLDLVAEELQGPQGRPVTVAGDLTDETIVDDLVSQTIWRFGGVDGAVFNVGIALPGEIRRLTTADWRRSLEVNTTSHFLLARRLLPALETQGSGGSLVFIGSKNMFSPGAGFGAYSASKAALAQLARLIAIEAGPSGIRSNIVNPDNVFEGSALWSPELRAQRAAVYGIEPEDLEAYYTQRNLMKVPITGTDVAKAVAFLLSDDASRTTACVLTVDGGVPGVFPR
jgi:NAD(P)-dependent dehydrogenase (short-subunit alcohol dehydrogenase family)